MYFFSGRGWVDCFAVFLSSRQFTLEGLVAVSENKSPWAKMATTALDIGHVDVVAVVDYNSSTKQQQQQQMLLQQA